MEEIQLNGHECDRCWGLKDKAPEVCKHCIWNPDSVEPFENYYDAQWWDPKAEAWRRSKEKFKVPTLDNFLFMVKEGSNV